MKFVLPLHYVEKLVQPDGRNVRRENDGPRERNALFLAGKQLKEHALLRQQGSEQRGRFWRRELYRQLLSLTGRHREVDVFLLR